MDDRDHAQLRQSGWYLDLGAGNRVDAEFDAPETLWIALGSGMRKVRLWLKSVSGVDVRVAIERSLDTITVTLDGGEEGVQWYEPYRAPRLQLSINSNNGTGTLTATDATGREIVLGCARVR